MAAEDILFLEGESGGMWAAAGGWSAGESGMLVSSTSVGDGRGSSLASGVPNDSSSVSAETLAVEEVPAPVTVCSDMLANTRCSSVSPPRAIGGLVATTVGNSGDTGESAFSADDSVVVVRRASVLGALLAGSAEASSDMSQNGPN